MLRSQAAVTLLQIADAEIILVVFAYPADMGGAKNLDPDFWRFARLETIRHSRRCFRVERAPRFSSYGWEGIAFFFSRSL